MLADTDAELHALFARYDAAGDRGGPANDSRRILNRRRYIQNLVRDVDKARRTLIAT